MVYQVVWVRELVLVFGATTFAVSTVLTTFMGGLALGSFYFGRRSEKIVRPLRLYGWIEIGIGLYGLAVPLIFAALPNIYQPFWQRLHVSFFGLSLIRFLFAALVLLLPTALMGATLPVLSSYYARDLRSLGLRVGSLYSLNTFGAVIGAAATGFFLIPGLGMQATTVVAAAMNIILGVIALSVARLEEAQPAPASAPLALSDTSETHLRKGKRWLLAWLPALINSRRAAREQNQSAASTASLTASSAPVTRPPGRAGVITVLAGFALSGFIALSYEVIWSRVLALIIGSSVYAFSIMLTTFLIGLAVGASFASRFVDKIKRRVLAFAFIEIGVGITSLVGAYLFNDLPYIFVQLYRWLDGSTLGVLLFARFLVASLVMIVPTLLLGALFPLVVRIISDSARDRATGRTVGDAYAANTLGAIAGSFASGFILIPWLGLLDSLRICAALNFVIAAALFIVVRLNRVPTRSHEIAQAAGQQKQRRAKRKTFVAPGELSPRSRRIVSATGFAASAVLVVVVVLFEPPWDSEVMSSAVYRYAPSMSSMSRQELFEYLKRGQGESIFYKEGITATVAVQQQGGGRVLKVNGKPEASTTGDMPTQILIGSLPLLMREHTENVLMIGLGSGITLGSVEQFPIKQITCVELEPAVVEASRYFDDVNNRPLDDPRLRMVSNDGRNFIFTSDEKFDVIISEPSNPWLTGVANLFTLEYFMRGAERLKDDGLFSQWLQIYEMSPEDVKTLVATFRKAFAYVYIFRGSEGDLMLIGSKRERQLNLQAIKSHFNYPKVTADLKRINTSSAADLLSRFYLGPAQIDKFCGAAPINTDDNALIEFSAPRRVGTAEETVVRNVTELLAHATSFGEYLAGHSAYAHGEADFLIEAALGAIKRADTARAEQYVDYSLELAETAQAHSVRGELRLARGNEPGALESWQQALALDPNHFYTLINMGKVYLTKQDATRAATYLDRAVAIQPESARAHHLRGLAYQARGDNASAVKEYRRTLPDAQYTRGIPTFYLNFGAALAPLGLYEEAAQMFEEYARLAPNDFEAHYQLGAVYEIMAERTLDDQMTARAVEELKRALTLKPNHAMSHYYLSKAYRRLGLYDEAEAEFEKYERFSP